MRVTGEPILAVLGAINVDLVVSGAPLPRPGETVIGGRFAEHQGGKGGNQAVAAGRAIQRGAVLAVAKNVRAGVWMLAAVGDDQRGVGALESLRTDGVQTERVLLTSAASTGVALIAVDERGENQISVAPGANDQLGPRPTIDALESLGPDMLLASLEIAEPTVRAALEWCHERGVPVVLNPAPYRPWARDVAQLTTYLTPNEQELEALGRVPSGPIVIETRGAAGARIHASGGVIDIPAIDVDVVDTTGAGDCFNGVLAAGLVRNLSLRDAVRSAVVAAALSVTRPGARSGMPRFNEIQAALG